jgi:protein-S-isoprenylcysteine O-methyltransferase Ste14
MSVLELKIPPVLLTTLCAGLMAGAAATTPEMNLAPAIRMTVVLACLLVSALVGLAAVRAFRRASTTVNPMQPDRSGALVDSGIFRYSRNPMYLALLIVLIGWGFYLDSLAALAVTVVYLAYLNRFQIAPEERALRERFGDPFTAYCKRVRRWI